MRIIVGQRVIPLVWLPILGFFVIAIYPMELGQTLLKGAPDEHGHNIEVVKKVISGLALVVTLARFRRLPPLLRNLFLIAMSYLLFLSFESFYKYNNFFMYPHVFGKFFVLFSCTAMYILFRGAKEEVYTASLLLLAAVFIFDIVAFYPQVLSIGSFMNIERGLHAGCVSLLMAVWLYAFNSYLPTTKAIWLVFFFILSAFILFLNHRTVWLSSTTSMTLTLILINYKGSDRYSPTAFTPIVLIPVIGAMLVFSYVFSEKPELLQNITERITDIEKVNERGTGKWRLEQFESYLPFILDHPLFGMRFEGFELPVQFFAEQTGKEVFDAHSGHHFHSYYMDNLFYHGLFGLCVLSGVFLYPIIQLLRLPVKLPNRLVGLSVWTLAALQYGLSYPIDDFHFAIAGFTLAGIDTYLDKVDAERVKERKAVLSQPVFEEVTEAMAQV